VPGFEAQIPFEQRAREIIDWYDEDPARPVVAERLDAALTRRVRTWHPHHR
jgi:hypothetical protein